MISHGVEISIAGGVVEMVRAILLALSFFFFFFLNQLNLFTTSRYKNACKRELMAKKTSLYIHPGTREKTINPSPSGMGLTARQPHQIRNPTLTT